MTRAYILIRTKSPDTDLLTEKMKKIGGVVDACAVYGSYDIILELEARNLRKLRDKIIELRELEDTGETRTFIQMEKGEENFEVE
jgi:DNA-binding Lrp family transcriptional regulator